MLTLEKQRAVLLQLIADQDRYNFRIAEGNVERESALALQLKTDSLREKYLTKQQLLERNSGDQFLRSVGRREAQRDCAGD